MPERTGNVQRLADATYDVAYLLWQVDQGYLLAEDRAVGENWMRDDPAVMHEEDRASLPGWLDAAQEVIRVLADQRAAWKAEALRRVADEIEHDDDGIGMNIILGGPSYVAYLLRDRAARIVRDLAAGDGGGQK